MTLRNSSQGPMAARKAEAEIAKLRHEAQKLQSDTELAVKQHRLEHFKAIASVVTAIASAVTTIVAILALFTTIRAQNQNNEAETIRRENEIFLAALRQYGDSSVNARLAGAAALEQYMLKPSGDRQKATTQLHVTALELEKSEAVRAQLRGSLVRNPSELAISTLRDRNISLQGELRYLLKLDESEFVHWVPTNHDGPEIQKLVGLLQDNARTIIDVLNSFYLKHKEIRSVNLSRVVFSMPTIVLGEFGGNKGLPFYFAPRYSSEFLDGIKFINVDFSGAKLQWLVFNRCLLLDTTLDHAQLSNTVFRRCKLEGTTSLEEYFWTIERPGLSELPVVSTTWVGSLLNQGPSFINSTVNINALHPATNSRSIIHGSALTITDSTWKIASMPNDLLNRFQLSNESKINGTMNVGSGSLKVIVPSSLKSK